MLILRHGLFYIYSTRLLIGPHDDGLGAIETSVDFPDAQTPPTPPSRSPLSPLLPWSFVFAFIVFIVFSVFIVFRMDGESAVASAWCCLWSRASPRS